MTNLHVMAWYLVTPRYVGKCREFSYQKVIVDSEFPPDKGPIPKVIAWEIRYKEFYLATVATKREAVEYIVSKQDT